MPANLGAAARQKLNHRSLQKRDVHGFDTVEKSVQCFAHFVQQGNVQLAPQHGESASTDQDWIEDNPNVSILVRKRELAQIH